MERLWESIYEGDDFTFVAEVAGGYLFIHGDALDNSLATQRKMKRYFNMVKDNVDEDIYIYTQNPRFSEFLGLKYFANVTVDNEYYEVWVCQQQQ